MPRVAEASRRLARPARRVVPGRGGAHRRGSRRAARRRASRAAASDQLQLARFTSGPLPVVVWSDRNGDGRADVVEIYRGGGVVVQLIDADYDGTANVLRIYDGSGKLLRQERM